MVKIKDFVDLLLFLLLLLLLFLFPLHYYSSPCFGCPFLTLFWLKKKNFFLCFRLNELFYCKKKKKWTKDAYGCMTLNFIQVLVSFFFFSFCIWKRHWFKYLSRPLDNNVFNFSFLFFYIFFLKKKILPEIVSRSC